MLKWIGVLFLMLAGGVLVSDAVAWLGGGGFRLTAMGEWWFWLHRDSLQVAQPAIERHVAVWLWTDVVQPLLEWPFALELGALGGVFFALGLIRR